MSTTPSPGPSEQPFASSQPPPSQPPPQPPPPAQPLPAPGPRMSPDTERSWAVASHLSAFVAAYVALGFLGPLVCMLAIGDRSPAARRHAVEALNFNLTWLLYIAVSAVLTVILVGFVLLVALAIAYVILVIMAAVAASRGEEFRYPLTLRLVS